MVVLSHSQVLQRGGVVTQTSEEAARLSANSREVAARQNVAVRLHRDGVDSAVRAWVESGVERAVRIQPGDAVARNRRSAIGRERGKIATEKNLAVRLDDHDSDGAVRVRIETVQCGFPAHCRRTARQQPGNGKQ